MKLSESVKPISYLKARASEVLGQVATEGKTFIITQHGEAKAILQDIASYEQTQESLALLKLLAQSQQSAEAGRHKPIRKAFSDLATRVKDLP